ncbi:MAG: hypothetical protein IPP94_11215 [Ignavibacteria bacterium]|nr:hypothetical protein [Ignavibacteria bacterium]
MKNIHIVTAALILAALVLSPAAARAQDGSYEKSWNNAGSEKKAEPMQRVTPAPARQGEKATYPVWDKARQSDVKPWRPAPSAQPAPAPRGYYGENRMLIDSLSNLFCLSTSYLRSLTNRNEAARLSAVAPPPERDPNDFQYRNEPADRKRPQMVDPLATLNSELQRLLEQCLYGR